MKNLRGQFLELFVETSLNKPSPFIKLSKKTINNLHKKNYLTEILVYLSFKSKELS